MINSQINSENITLLYHQFDYSLTNIYSVIPEIFEWQMNYIRENKIEVINVNDMINKYNSKKEEIGNNVLITIDDGWKNEMNIVPIIQKYKIPVTIYIFPKGLNIYSSYFSFNDLKKLENIDEISFGSHSFSHHLLINTPSTEMIKEISKSKIDLQNILSKKIESFAYPYGICDLKAEKITAKNYQIAFSTNNGVNSRTTDRSSLNRNTIFRATTFGEYIDILKDISGTKKEYKIQELGYGDNGFKRFKYEKVKLYQFPINEKDKNVLVVPDTKIGVGWFYKGINKLKENDIKSNVVVGRNNNVPFFRPVKEKLSMNNWDIDSFMFDLKKSIEFVSKNKKIVIVSWGDGFDLIMATLSKYNLSNKINGVVVINPSIPINDKKLFNLNVNYYNYLLKTGRYSSEPFTEFLKFKTLSDLAVSNENDLSPFSTNLGYKKMSNYDLLIRVLKNDLSLNFSLEDNIEFLSYDDFKGVFTNILPAFNKFIPINLQKNINELWCDDFYSENYGIMNKDNLNFPVVYIFNGEYRNNYKRLKTTFKNLKINNTYNFKNRSTIEMLLSNDVLNFLTLEINEMYL